MLRRSLAPMLLALLATVGSLPGLANANSDFDQALEATIGLWNEKDWDAIVASMTPETRAKVGDDFGRTFDLTFREPYGEVEKWRRRRVDDTGGADCRRTVLEVEFHYTEGEIDVELCRRNGDWKLHFLQVMVSPANSIRGLVASKLLAEDSPRIGGQKCLSRGEGDRSDPRSVDSISCEFTIEGEAACRILVEAEVTEAGSFETSSAWASDECRPYLRPD